MSVQTTMEEDPAVQNSAKRKPKKRVRNFTSDDRAQHRVIEKQRRESLNSNFVDLARQIPRLADVRRLSKSLIVKESVDYLRQQRRMRQLASRELHELLAERSKMREELTLWRAMYGTAGPADSAKSIVGVGPGFAELLRVEEETLGTFPHGFGENGSEEEHAGGARQGSNDSIGQSSQGRRASNEDETSAPATSLPPYPPAITTTGRHMVQRVQQVQQSGPHGPMQGANQRPPVEWGYGMSHGQQHGLMLESPLTATSEFDTLLDMLQYPTSAVSDTVDADVWSINGIARATTSAVLPPAYYTSDSEHAFASAALSR